ncbi:MAG: U32 family peptidase [Rhodospirillaceae bacterium]
MTKIMKDQGLRLTLGPVLFNWAPEIWRDFYFRMADEAPVDRVVIGEIVCSKRTPFLAPYIPEVIERLQAAGREVMLASPILVTLERERGAVRELVEQAGDLLIEANDMGCLAQLGGRPHHVGPYVNVYNEATLAWMAGRGALSFSLNGELTATAVAALGRVTRSLGVELEVQVFGRLPLAISVRCYHARSRGLHKDNCRFVCAEDADGLAVTTLDGESFLAVNGTQTLSHSHVALTAEVADLHATGVNCLRLSPHSCDMVAVARIFRDLADGAIDAAKARAGLSALTGDARLSNGFYHDREGVADVFSGETRTSGFVPMTRR